MKHILMMHAPRGTGDYEINAWSGEASDAQMCHMYRLNDELAVGASAAPGPDGAPLSMPIDVRQVVEHEGTQP